MKKAFSLGVAANKIREILWFGLLKFVSGGISICEISSYCCGFVGFCFVFGICDPLIHYFVCLTVMFGIYVYVYVIVSLFKCYLRKQF